METTKCLEQAALALQRGDFGAAAQIYEAELAKAPNSQESIGGLGMALQRLGRHSQAVGYLERAASLGSNDPRIFASLGNCYFGLGRMDSAVASYKMASELRPESAQYLVQVAHGLIKQQQQVEAEKCLLRAIELDSGHAPAHDMMAFLLPQMGRFEEAREFARTAVSLDPDNPAYLVRFVYSSKVEETDRDMATRLEAMAQSQALRPNDRIRVEYGLGKAMEDLESFEQAADHYVRANALAAKLKDEAGVPFSRKEHSKDIDLIIKTFFKPIGGNSPSQGSPSELPVFIVGMMRSGTTLVEQILSSHPDVGGAGELPFWLEWGPRLTGAISRRGGPSSVNQTAKEYLQLLAALAPGKSRVCDKLPQNYLALGAILTAFPNARIVHCRRDPRDTCLSIFTTPFTYPPPFAFRSDAIGFAYGEYLRIMAHWREVLPPERLFELDYEELVADQETVSRRLIQFLGLEWSDACRHPERNGRIVGNPSQWQVRQPVYGRSVGRWQRFAPWLKQISDWNIPNDV